MNEDQGKLLFESDKKYLKKWHYIGGVMLIGGLIGMIFIIYLLDPVLIAICWPFFLLSLFGISSINVSTLKVFEKGLITPRKPFGIQFKKNVKFIEFKNIIKIVIYKNEKKTVSIEIELDKKAFGKKKFIPPKLKIQNISYFSVGESGLKRLKKILKEKCADIEMSTKSIQ
jgi:hypothetical protein